MNILALDPAENFGWAVGSKKSGQKDIWGHWTFKLKRDEAFAMKLIRFETELQKIVEKHNIEVIAFERPSGRMPAAIMSHAKFVAVVEVFCTKRNIPYTAYSATEIKKFATDKGNANKKQMIKAAILKIGYRGKDDNEADAMWILAKCKSEL